MITYPPSVGLLGRKRSGKSTAADYLAANFGYRQIAFADPLRAMARALNPVVGLTTSYGEVRYTEAEDRLGYEGAKDFYPEFRRVLQVLGTEAVRGVLGDTTWVDHLEKRITAAPGPYAVTDVRFPNEADLLKGYGFTLIRIVRPGTEDDDPHPSETALDDYPADYTITNDGTVQGLYFALNVILRPVLIP